MALVQQLYSLPQGDPGASPIPIASPMAHSPTMTQPLPLTTSTKALRHWQSQPTLRSKASTQLNQVHAQAQLPYHSVTSTTQTNRGTVHTMRSSPSSSSSSSSCSSSSSIAHAAAKTQSSFDLNRTQQKLMLQRQSFLADDKHHLDHPANMKRLTKEMDRINREYRCVRHYEDPMIESFLRVTTAQSPPLPFSSSHPYSPTYSTLSSSSASSTTSLSSSGLLMESITKISPLPPQPPLLQRRASDFILQRQDRRNSSTSVHSAMLDRHHPPACHFLVRWFKPSLPPTKRRHSHFTC